MQSAGDDFSEATAKKIIPSHGASVHGLPALRTFPGNNWLDIAMIRMNHKGTKMDSEGGHDAQPGNVEEVTARRRYRSR